jgi:hypothetical protein
VRLAEVFRFAAGTHRLAERHTCEAVNRRSRGASRSIARMKPINSQCRWCNITGTGERFQSCQFRDAPQPPYSPDISPCDFFLFDDLKTKPKGEELESMEKLQDSVKDGLGLVTSETIRQVYELRIARLNQMTDIGWD